LIPMKGKKSATHTQFLQFIAISLAVHVLMLVGMNQFNFWDTSKILNHSRPIDLDQYIIPHSHTPGSVQADSPTRYVVDRDTGKSIMVVFPVADTDGTFRIDIRSETGEPFALLFDDTHSPFSLTAQGVLVGQNIGKDLAGYTPNRAYALFTFTHGDYVQQGTSHVLHLELSVAYRTEGMRSNSYVLIGSNNDLNKYVQQRLMVASIIFGCYLFLLLISIIVFLQFKSGYLLVTICLSLVMTTRFVLLGEYPFLGSLQLLPSNYVFIADYFLAVMIFLLAQILAKSLFSFKVSNTIVVAYGLVFVVLEMFGILRGYLSITLAMHVMGMLATIYMASSQHNEYRRYGLLVILSYSVFSASVSSQILLYLGFVNRGISILMMFTNQFSALLYIASFIFAVIRTNSLRLRTLQLQQQSFERSILLRGISHDLKLPLSVIKLNTQMRGAYSMSEEEHKHLDATVLQATHELEEMTMNINAYLNAASDTQERATCRVRECLGEIASRYAYFGIERGIVLETWFAEREHVIPISTLQFDRMVGNLLDNAFKYTGDSGNVILRYTFGKHMVISVEDTGIGIDSEELELILNPFYRSESGRNTKGSGLGLSVVKAIADNLGATLHIDSVLGQGTCVTITIPI